MDFIWCEKEGYGFLNDYLELKKELQNSNSINEKILISIILVFESVRIVLREFSYSRIEGAILILLGIVILIGFVSG